MVQEIDDVLTNIDEPERDDYLNTRAEDENETTDDALGGNDEEEEEMGEELAEDEL